jgi:putative toxin-antitoxin system antitoxin component (TIGR02293 family)
MEVNVLAPIKKYQPRPQIPQRVWMSLGLPSRGTKLHDLIREGLPFELLDRIASLLQVQQGAISKAICMSPTTMARRAKAGRFNTLESDRLVTMIAVFEKAISLFERDVAAAAGWMSTPVRGLGSKLPLDMMRVRVETKAIFDLIGRLERGVLV